MIPKTTSLGLRLPNAYRNDLTVGLSIPEDDELLSCLIEKHEVFNYFDLRKCLNRDNKYEKIEISDKGQKHRGVVALFTKSSAIPEVLTNSYWRKIIRDSFKSTNSSFSIDRLEAMIRQLPRTDFNELMDSFRFSNVGEAKNYAIHNLHDTIEHFVHNGVLLQTHTWKCSYCGNANKRSLDTLKLSNHCDVCQTEYLVTIDFEWDYSISPFVVSALAEHNGLTVLWGVSILLNQSRIRQSIYLPEVDLYKDFTQTQNNNEVDLIALIDGKLVISEVKRSAASFIDSAKEQESFIDEISCIQPDIAYLVFEQYCDNCDDQAAFKESLKGLLEELKQKTPPLTQIQVIVASETADFNSFPGEVGPSGRRAEKFLQSLDL